MPFARLWPLSRRSPVLRLFRAARVERQRGLSSSRQGEREREKVRARKTSRSEKRAFRIDWIIASRRYGVFTGKSRRSKVVEPRDHRIANFSAKIGPFAIDAKKSPLHTRAERCAYAIDFVGQIFFQPAEFCIIVESNSRDIGVLFRNETRRAGMKNIRGWCGNNYFGKRRGSQRKIFKPPSPEFLVFGRRTWLTFVCFLGSLI